MPKTVGAELIAVHGAMYRVAEIALIMIIEVGVTCAVVVMEIVALVLKVDVVDTQSSRSLEVIADLTAKRL